MRHPYCFKPLGPVAWHPRYQIHCCKTLFYYTEAGLPNCRKARIKKSQTSIDDVSLSNLLTRNTKTGSSWPTSNVVMVFRYLSVKCGCPYRRLSTVSTHKLVRPEYPKRQYSLSWELEAIWCKRWKSSSLLVSGQTRLCKCKSIITVRHNHCFRFTFYCLLDIIVCCFGYICP